MHIEEFMENVIQEIKKELGGMYHIVTEEVIKNNGIVCHGITIRNRGSNISPCIYADGIYGEFSSGETSLEEAAEKILRIYWENRAAENFDTRWLTDYGKARQMLRGCLINTGRNRELLKDVPHRNFWICRWYTGWKYAAWNRESGQYVYITAILDCGAWRKKTCLRQSGKTWRTWRTPRWKACRMR